MQRKTIIREGLLLIVIGSLSSISSGQNGPALRPLDVFVVAGQSNATGLASPVELQQVALREGQTDVWFYANSTVWTPDSLPNAAAWAVAHPPEWRRMKLPTEPETQPRGVSTQVAGTFGPEFALGRQYAADKHTEVALIKADWPGSNLHVQWNPQATDGPMYFQKMLANVHSGLRDLKARGREGRIRAFFWMQGEGDVSQTGETYRADLAAFVAAVRRDLDAPRLPFIFGQIANQGGEAGDIAGVQNAQASVAKVVPGTAMVCTNDLPLRPTDSVIDPYPIHFNTAAQLALGERFAWAYECMTTPLRRTPIAGLVNTGMKDTVTATNTDQESNRLALKAEETHWKVNRGRVGAKQAPAGAINGLAHSSKSVTAYPNSQWIGTSLSRDVKRTSFTSYFNLARIDGVVITGQFAAAEGTRVLLNGHDLNLQPLFGARDWTPFSLEPNTLPGNAPFVKGENTLTFVAPPGPSGVHLRVEFLNAVTGP